jgi:hypothetical protein
LHKAVPPAVTSAWYQRLMEQRPDGMSWLEWIRRPPARRSPKTLRRAVGKLLSLRDFDDGLEEGRIVIPPERLRAYGRRLRRRKPAHVKSIVEPRRTLEIAGFLHTAIAHEADRVLRMLEMRIAQIWRWAYGVTSDQNPSRPQAGEEILWALQQRVEDPELSDGEFRDFAKARLNEWCSKRSPSMQSRAARVRAVLAGDTRCIRSLLKDVILLKLEGAPEDPVLKALQELETSYRFGWDDLFASATVPFARTRLRQRNTKTLISVSDRLGGGFFDGSGWLI